MRGAMARVISMTKAAYCHMDKAAVAHMIAGVRQLGFSFRLVDQR